MKVELQISNKVGGGRKKKRKRRSSPHKCKDSQNNNEFFTHKPLSSDHSSTHIPMQKAFSM